MTVYSPHETEPYLVPKDGQGDPISLTERFYMLSCAPMLSMAGRRFSHVFAERSDIFQAVRIDREIEVAGVDVIDPLVAASDMALIDHICDALHYKSRVGKYPKTLPEGSLVLRAVRTGRSLRRLAQASRILGNITLGDIGHMMLRDNQSMLKRTGPWYALTPKEQGEQNLQRVECIIDPDRVRPAGTSTHTSVIVNLPPSATFKDWQDEGQVEVHRGDNAVFAALRPALLF